MSNHHGLLESNALKSLPTETVDMVFKCSLVIIKQRMNMTKHAEAIITMAQNQPVDEL